MGYSADGRRWISNACELDLNSPALDTTWQGVARKAMQLWNTAGASFNFKETAGASNDVDAYDNGRWNGWIALTWTSPIPAGSSLSSARIVINLHYEWDPAHATVAATDKSGSYDLYTALAHEFGHTLHLGEDTSGKRTMMHPKIKPGETRVLDADDRAGILFLYP